MVTTRSQDKKHGDSELPVRPRSEDILSSLTLKRPRSPIEDAPSTKRLRTESTTPVDISQAPKAPAPSSETAHDVVVTSQLDQAVAATDPSHLADESSHIGEKSSHATAEPLETIAEEVNSDGQPLEYLRQDPPKSARDADEAVEPLNDRPDSLTPKIDTNNLCTPRTGPSQVHKRFGSEDGETDIFMTPETSRKTIVPETPLLLAYPESTPLPPDPGETPYQADIHTTPQEAHVAVATRPAALSRRPVRILEQYPRPKLISLASPVNPSSSISRYRQTVLERHKRTPFWGGRKARFVDVRAQ